MKTFVKVEEAFKLILENTNIDSGFEYIPIEDALNRVCFEDVVAIRNAPPFSNSAMDGYALHSSDSGKTLPIAGAIFAGDNTDIEIQKGQCYKIMTGAILPSNCDCVVPFECAIDADDTKATMPDNLFTNQNCRIKGEEFSKNKTLLQKGSLITPQAIALLGSQGIMYVKVNKSLQIAILSSGDEIIEPWEKVSEHQIYNSNTITLKMLLKQYGFKADYKGVFPDNLDKSIEFIDKLKDYDVIISTGGVSMGEADFVSEAFVQNKMKPIFHKIKIKPGGPMLYGKMGKTSVFALPGNPMSSFLICLNFVIPSLLKHTGSTNLYFNPIKAKATNSFGLTKNKVAVVLGELKADSFSAIDDNKYNSGMLSPLVKANAMALFSEDKTKVEKGESIKVISLYSPMNDIDIDLINKG